jgi:hypothetical protein
MGITSRPAVLLLIGLVTQAPGDASASGDIQAALACRQTMSQDIDSAPGDAAPRIVPNFGYTHAWPNPPNDKAPAAQSALLISSRFREGAYYLAQKRNGMFQYEEIHPFAGDRCPERPQDPRARARVKVVKLGQGVGEPPVAPLLYCTQLGDTVYAGICHVQDEGLCAHNAINVSTELDGSSAASTQAIRTTRITEADFLAHFQKEVRDRAFRVNEEWRDDERYRRIRSDRIPSTVKVFEAAIDRILAECAGFLDAKSRAELEYIKREMRQPSGSTAGSSDPAPRSNVGGAR